MQGQEKAEDVNLWVMEGDWRRRLQGRGVESNHPQWLARLLKENPDMVFELHQESLRAGVQVLTTATMGASLEGFIQYGMYQREARETIFSAVMMACLAREKYLRESGKNTVIRVAGLIGSYGVCRDDGSEKTGAYWTSERLGLDTCDLGDYYDPLIEILLAPRKNFRIDFLVFDSFPLMEEARDVLLRLKKYPGARCVFCFSRLEAALAAAPLMEQDPQVLAWGLNGLSEEETDTGLQDIQARRTGSKPLVARPSVMENLARVNAWRQLGVQFVSF